MGSRGTLDRSSLRRVAGLLTAKPNALRRPASMATALDRAEIDRLGDTSSARLLRVVSSAAAADRPSGGESSAGDSSSHFLLIADLDGEAGTKACGVGAVVSSKAKAPTTEKLAADGGMGGVAHGVSVKLRRKALESRLVSLTQVPLGTPLAFESQLFASSEASAPVDECLRGLLESLKTAEDPEKIARLEEALLTALLTCCKHNYSLRFREATGTGLPRHVKLVEDYIHKNAEKPITMKDLERITEVSARSILPFGGFEDIRPRPCSRRFAWTGRTSLCWPRIRAIRS